MPYDPGMADRYRCTGCGNLTRFDVVATRRTRSFHHYSVAGDLVVDEETVLDETVESVECRWCGASGDRIETLDPAVELPAGPPGEPGPG